MNLNDWELGCEAEAEACGGVSPETLQARLGSP